MLERPPRAGLTKKRGGLDAGGGGGGESPILLLDDLFSELDQSCRKATGEALADGLASDTGMGSQVLVASGFPTLRAPN